MSQPTTIARSTPGVGMTAAVPSAPESLTADDVAHALAALARGRHRDGRAALGDLIARDGLGEVNAALGEIARCLLDQVRVPAGTLDVRSAVADLATRTVELTGVSAALTGRLRSLIVYLGGEHLLTAARSDVAAWRPIDRTDLLVTLGIGLAAVVARESDGDVVQAIRTAVGSLGSEPVRPRGHFMLGAVGAPDVTDAVDTTPRLLFEADEPCTLRGIFARVTRLAEDPTAPQHDPLRAVR